MKITVLTFINKSTGAVSVELYSAQCSASEASELWVGEKSDLFTAVDPRSYYDKKLAERRNAGNMISPWEPKDRIRFVGHIKGVEPRGNNDFTLLSSSTIEAVAYVI